MTDPTPILDDGSDLPEVVSVTIKPEALTSFEEWRMVLVRLAPRSRRPALIRVIVIAYLLISFGTLGYIVGTQGSPGLNPVVMALAGSGVGLLYMVRLWSVKTVLIKGLRELGSVTIELRRESATIRSKHRVTARLGGRPRDADLTGRDRAGISGRRRFLDSDPGLRRPGARGPVPRDGRLRPGGRFSPT
jgi:hypothetical protein